MNTVHSTHDMQPNPVTVTECTRCWLCECHNMPQLVEPCKGVPQLPAQLYPIKEPRMDFLQRAKNLIEGHVLERLDKSDDPVAFETYIVWFSKTLQNWKALLSTTLPDGMYYEVTYNGDKGETYIDAYKKVENRLVRDETTDSN